MHPNTRYSARIVVLPKGWLDVRARAVADARKSGDPLLTSLRQRDLMRALDSLASSGVWDDSVASSLEMTGADALELESLFDYCVARFSQSVAFKSSRVSDTARTEARELAHRMENMGPGPVLNEHNAEAWAEAIKLLRELAQP